jgi:hypothetical protein
MSITVRCPACGQVAHVAARAGESVAGSVRCPECGSRFRVAERPRPRPAVPPVHPRFNVASATHANSASVTA